MEPKVFLGFGLAPSWNAGTAKAQKDLKGIGDQGVASTRQIAAATRQLPAQFTDIATQLAGGANPFLVLLQQGGQIKDSFGSIGAAARGITGAVSGTAAVVGGVAAAVGTLGYAIAKGRDESLQWRDTLLLTGNAAGLTASRVDQLATSVRDMSRQTESGAREIVMALAATGQTSGRVIEGQAKAIARISDLSGKAGKEVAASFAGQLDAPARFAAKLNEAYNFLNIAQFRRIQQLEQEKRNAEAVQLTNDALVKALDKQKQGLGYLETALDAVRRAASATWNALAGLGRDTSLSERIKKLQGDIQKIMDSAGGREPAAGTFSAGRIAALRKQLASAVNESLAQEREAARVSEEAAKTREQVEKALATGAVGPQLGAIRSAREQYRQDFLRSEKEFYKDLEEEDRKIRELARQDPLGEFIAERVLPDDRKRGEERLTAQAGILQELVDANARAGAELLEDERERGLALIELDRQIALRRLQVQGLTGQALGEASDEVNRAAGLAQLKLSRQIDATAKHAEDALTESVAAGILEGFRRGGSFAEVFLTELKAQFAKTILVPLIRPQVEAGNRLIGDLLGGLAGAIFGGGGISVDPSGAGLAPPEWAFATGDAIRGRRARGGRVEPFSTYLVGESGPELLRMGRQGGTVVPNGAGGVSVTNGPTVVNIDSRSDAAQVAQLVAGAVAASQQQLYDDLRARRVIG